MTDLPVERAIPDLRAALADGGTAVLQAEPGAGKSTIVPLRLVDDPWLAGRRIVMLEPRRLAARATARRMSHLLGEDVGGTVGYRTRDDRKVSSRTRVEVVTEGILTRRLQRDPSLDGVALVIFDEVHERNLQSDLALALSLDVRRSLRPDLGLLAMSATLDTARVAELLGGDDGPAAPVISSPGRTHPVDVRWRPRDPRARLGDAVGAVVREALRDDEGDVLVFLPGAAEIRWTSSALATGLPPDVDVRPLFGALSVAEQDAALSPSPPGRRRVVLSTDIAETSLTVAGVRVVVDAGLVRRPHHEGRSGLDRLVTSTASRASAEQRTGRAGRTEPGVAYRLWAESEHAGRPAYAEPEILGTDLASLALELAVWGAPATDLPFVDQPPPRRLAEAATLLRRLGAIDPAGRPTPDGRAMSDLPLHPRLARIVLAGKGDGSGPTACALAALLELGGGRADVGRHVDLESLVTSFDDRDRRARAIARRAGIDAGEVDPRAVADLAVAGYPDRIAGSRGGGRFRLRSGRGIALDATDPMAAASFLVVAELGPGARGSDDDRIRMAAAIDPADIERVAGDEIAEVHELSWNEARDDLEERTERRLDAVVLNSRTGRATAGPATAAALARRIADGHLDLLGWSAAARALQHRAAFARRGLGGEWPDLDDDALVATVDGWLEPRLTTATGRADLARVEMAGVLRQLLGHRAVADLDRVVPTTYTAPSGRHAPIDYSGEQPAVSVRVQDLYGDTTTHPTVADGRIPIVVHLLSPAGRDVQVTADLPGFWVGTWTEVRKELAGRYPKHDWPLDPASYNMKAGGRRGRRSGGG